MTDFAHEPVTLDNGLSGQPVVIPSGNPAHFYQAVSCPMDIPALDIHGQLFNAGKDAAVIVVPGSLGVAPSHLDHARSLCDIGLTVLVIDPFGSRQVTSTVANQAQYSFAASSWDVLRAAAFLSDTQGISRIGAQGHSRGGSAVINAAVRTFSAGADAPALAAVYAAYPWCGFQFVTPSVGSTRVRSIIGDLDEWCLPQQVQAYMHAIALLGGDATTRIIPGAHHSFDRETGVQLVPDASVAPAAPTTYLTDDGRYIHPVTGVCPTDTTDRELMLYGVSCGAGRRGAHIGTTSDQAAVFKDDMLHFWKTSFADLV